MAFELVEPLPGAVNSPHGQFAPRANQTKFRSAFAIVSGEKPNGWFDRHFVEGGGVRTQDGKGVLNFVEFKDEKGKPHDEHLEKGGTVREFIVPLEDCLAKEKYDGALSTAACNRFLQKTNTPSTDTSVGRRVLESTVQEINIPTEAAK